MIHKRCNRRRRQNTNGTVGMLEMELQIRNDREIQKETAYRFFFVPVYSDTFHGLLCQADYGAYNLL